MQWQTASPPTITTAAATIEKLSLITDYNKINQENSHHNAETKSKKYYLTIFYRSQDSLRLRSEGIKCKLINRNKITETVSISFGVFLLFLSLVTRFNYNKMNNNKNTHSHSRLIQVYTATETDKTKLTYEHFSFSFFFFDSLPTNEH